MQGSDNMDQDRLREVEFPAVDAPLKDDVRRLGALVGAMLAEQLGEDFYREVERLRTDAIRRREAALPIGMLFDAVQGKPTAEAERLARAFATYFQVVNVAERVHRIRRRRDYQIQVGGDQPGGLHEALTRAQSLGFTVDQVLAKFAELDIEPVFTAHPTEAVRQSLLQKEEEIVRCLLAEISGLRTPGESSTDWARMRTALTAGWQTATLSPVKPGVSDERDHVTHYLLEPIYRILPIFYEVLLDGFQRKFGVQPDLPRILRFATWVGGDMDGNPNVGPETIAETLAHQRKLIVKRYAGDLHQIGGLLSQTENLVSVSGAVLQRRDAYLLRLPAVAAQISPRHRDMPYRVLLRLIRARVEGIVDEREYAYRSASEFLDDLALIEDSLIANKGQHAGAFAVRRLRWRIRVFGFHLARLDVRQDSRVLSRVLKACDPELAAHAEPAARIADLAAGKAIAAQEIHEPQLARVKQVFATLTESRHRYGEQALGLFIISMAASAADVLTVLALARSGGLIDTKGHVCLDVAPLFETIEDLRAAPATMRALYSDPVYRAHLLARGDRQFVMLGYSDSAKDGGLLTARFALETAQTSLLALAAEFGVTLDFFHGRGGTVSRGGGKSTAAINAAPLGTMNGRLRVTEQGEVIHRKFGIDALALRTLAQTSASVFNVALAPPNADPREPVWHEAMAGMAERSLARYRQLVGEQQDFVQYFRAATPIDVIERMSLGSRPARRGGAAIRDLRAIPWVFAWTQSRCVLPGWFGLGSAIEAGIERHGLPFMRAMSKDWRFFQTLLSDVEMVVAKSDMAIAQVFSQLAGPLHAQFYPIIQDEHARTRALLGEITERELLANDPRLARSIRLRNPYVDPMSLLQADLLARWRAEDRPEGELLRALITCVQGVSQALQNTG